MVAGRQVARQRHVPIQYAARRIANGVVQVVRFHQHGVEPGDRALLRGARTLQQLGQERVDRGGIAFRRWWFAHGQADLPLRHGEARQ